MSDTTELTVEERKARRNAARAERRASVVKDVGTQRCVLFLAPHLQTQLTLLAMSTGRSVEEEALTAVLQFVKAPNQAKAIASQKDAMKTKLEADRAAADADFAKRLDLIESL